MKKNILIISIMIIIQLLSLNPSIYTNEDDIYMKIELIKTSKSKFLIVKKAENIVFIHFYGIYESLIENYIYGKYRNYKTIYLENDNTNYEIEDIDIRNDEIVKINDFFCMYLYQNPIDSSTCKILYVDDNLINYNLNLNYELDLIIYESKNFTNKTLEQIYYNWIDTYMITKNQIIEITIYSTLDYELKIHNI